MSRKSITAQQLKRRAPRQSRALHKVGLIFEATMQVLASGGTASLTTNAIAARAGISIGTLYQYFADKEAILDALSGQQLEVLADKVSRAMAQTPSQPGGRVGLLVSAVFDMYGGRRSVHQMLLEHALARGAGGRLDPLYGSIVNTMADTGAASTRMSHTEALVLTNAVSGVMRGVVASALPRQRREEVERALVRLVRGFLTHEGGLA